MVRDQTFPVGQYHSWLEFSVFLAEKVGRYVKENKSSKPVTEKWCCWHFWDHTFPTKICRHHGSHCLCQRHHDYWSCQALLYWWGHCHRPHDYLKGCAGEAGSETEGGGAGDGAGPGTLSSDQIMIKDCYNEDLFVGSVGSSFRYFIITCNVLFKAWHPYTFRVCTRNCFNIIKCIWVQLV